jgi:hypothetical protein
MVCQYKAILVCYYGLKVGQMHVWMHSSIRISRKKSTFRFRKAFKPRMRSRNELVLFVCSKNFMVSSKLQDSGTMQSMQRCIVWTALAVIPTLVYAKEKKRVSLWSFLSMLMILS